MLEAVREQPTRATDTLGTCKPAGETEDETFRR